MDRAAPTFTRRSVLAASLLPLLAACGAGRPRRIAATADPDAAALDAAIAAERQFLAGYGALRNLNAADSTARDAHAAHLAALLDQRGPTGRAAPSTVVTDPVTAGFLRKAETNSVTTLRDAAVAARRGTVAAVLASVAASHAVLGARHR